MGMHVGFEREVRRPDGTYSVIRVRRTGVAPLFPHGYNVVPWAVSWWRRLLRRDRTWTVAVLDGRMNADSQRRTPLSAAVVPTFEAARRQADKLESTLMRAAT